MLEALLVVAALLTGFAYGGIYESWRSDHSDGGESAT